MNKFVSVCKCFEFLIYERVSLSVFLSSAVEKTAENTEEGRRKARGEYLIWIACLQRYGKKKAPVLLLMDLKCMWVFKDLIQG